MSSLVIFQCRFVHILQEGGLLVCPVIVIRDLDHYYFVIHSIVVPKSLVELLESLCISYVNMNKSFYKPTPSWPISFIFPTMYLDVCTFLVSIVAEDNNRLDGQITFSFNSINIFNHFGSYHSNNAFCVSILGFSGLFHWKNLTNEQLL